MMQEKAFKQWEKSFRRDAEKDGMALLREHLQRLDLRDEPEKLLNGTIMFMSACCAYLNIDGRAFNDFLAIQGYRPLCDGVAHYSFTFNLYDRVYARIITPIDVKYLDFADLYGHPWYEFKMCGFSDFCVSRIDSNALSKDEIEQIEKVISDDIRFDYSEEEVDFWTDQDSIDGVLLVCVYDVENDDEGK
jgi:hypothetical protein